MKQKCEMPIGQKVRGYGILNEYGEFEFTPEQTGTRQGRVKVIKNGANYTLSSTKHSLILHCNIKKGQTLEMVKELTQVMSNIIVDLKSYAI